jgi:hypothetical protein
MGGPGSGRKKGSISGKSSIKKTSKEKAGIDTNNERGHKLYLKSLAKVAKMIKANKGKK